MDARPIIYALILGWVTGKEELPPTFANWAIARNTLNARDVESADCSYMGTDFELRQVLLQDRKVVGTEP